MHIRPTEPHELPALASIYARARQFMRESGNPNQWGTNHPPMSVLEENVLAGRSFVCEAEGQLAATFCFLPGPDPTYSVIFHGAWLSDAPYSVIHRIASAGLVPGAGSYCIDWCFQQCGNLRIDTHRENTVMQKLLQKQGFSYCGIIHLANGDERLAYQKKAP